MAAGKGAGTYCQPTIPRRMLLVCINKTHETGRVLRISLSLLLQFPCLFRCWLSVSLHFSSCLDLLVSALVPYYNLLEDEAYMCTDPVQLCS